jgi:hypothetical protein
MRFFQTARGQSVVHAAGTDQQWHRKWNSVQEQFGNEQEIATDKAKFLFPGNRRKNTVKKGQRRPNKALQIPKQSISFEK